MIKNNNLVINTKRFYLKSITTSYANKKYRDWLLNPKISKFIHIKPTMKELHDYIKKKISKQDTIFLAIHSITDKAHIGNIKYEPVDIKKKYALMGIMIGEQNLWGKGAAMEVITASSKFLKEKYLIEEIILAVNESHMSAIKAYEKIGFEFCSSKYTEQKNNSILTMTLKTKSLY